MCSRRAQKVVVYRYSDDLEKFGKMLKDADKQFVEVAMQIKKLAEEKELREKELDELKATAQAIIDMVDPPEEEAAQGKILLERLQGAPQKIVKYLSDTSRQYVSHVLGLVKFYWPKANLIPLGEGMSVECTEERFADLMEEMKPIADRIVDVLELEPEAEQ